MPGTVHIQLNCFFKYFVYRICSSGTVLRSVVLGLFTIQPINKSFLIGFKLDSWCLKGPNLHLYYTHSVLQTRPFYISFQKNFKIKCIESSKDRDRQRLQRLLDILSEDYIRVAHI